MQSKKKKKNTFPGLTFKLLCALLTQMSGMRSENERGNMKDTAYMLCVTVLVLRLSHLPSLKHTCAHLQVHMPHSQTQTYFEHTHSPAQCSGPGSSQNNSGAAPPAAANWELPVGLISFSKLCVRVCVPVHVRGEFCILVCGCLHEPTSVHMSPSSPSHHITQ